MQTLTLYLVRLPEALRQTCVQAAHDAFPHARIKPVQTVTEAQQQPPAGRELLILTGSNEAESGLASQALDAGDQPRWAVIHLGREPSDLFETVPPEDWHIRPLSRIFRTTLMQHDLLRENLLLRGDLKTIARRVTHDFRTPLGCILTVCESLKDPRRPSMPSAEAVAAIRISGEELTRLTDTVSFLLKASLDPLPPLILTMGSVMEPVLQELRPEIERTGHKIRQPASWPDVAGVPGWLEFIWIHLIQNALRHGARTGTVQLGWTRQDKEIRFWVANQGTVPPAIRDRLLSPFHLLHQQTSVGLGLSLVERLVTLQGGRCGYETTDDSRSVFFFTLPAVAAAPDPTPPLAQPSLRDAS